MTREEIFQKLKTSLCELFEFNEDRVSGETNIVEDLDLDSIDVFDLLSKLEETVGGELIPEDFKDCRTVDNVVDKLLEVLEADSTSSDLGAGAT